MKRSVSALLALEAKALLAKVPSWSHLSAIWAKKAT